MTGAPMTGPTMTARHSLRHAALARVLPYASALVDMDRAQRVTAMRAWVEASGGVWIDAPTGSWGPHFVELSLMGFAASGSDMPDAIAEWIKAVTRAGCAAVDDGTSAA